MSEDEIVVLAVCGLGALILWGRWFWQNLSVSSLFSSQDDRYLMYATPLLCAGVLFSVLKRFASHDVRDDLRYLGFYMVMGAAWVGLFQNILHQTGLSARDDAIERRNKAAALALCGALVGLTLCFAGANIGDGPGWWVVIFCAGLSTGAWFVLWLVLAECSDCVEAVTVERDVASGLRLAGWFVAVGLVLGRAVAGNWVSVEATVGDFVNVAWPVLALAAVAIVLERLAQPSSDEPVRPVITFGLLPAIIYIAAAAAYVVWKGVW
jgi:uncharacterized membrane protein YjfL (UPF0719 family)